MLYLLWPIAEIQWTYLGIHPRAWAKYRFEVESRIPSVKERKVKIARIEKKSRIERHAKKSALITGLHVRRCMYRKKHDKKLKSTDTLTCRIHLFRH